MEPSDTRGRVDAAYLRRAARRAPATAGWLTGLLDPLGGARVLDVGCGSGEWLPALLAAVGPDGRVTGVDLDPDLLAAVPISDPRLSLEVADARSLPFPDATFDAAAAVYVLQHVDHPGRAVAELARVVVPGGRVGLVDVDWATLSIAGGDPDVERRLVGANLDHGLRNGTAGRQLLGLLRGAGLAGVRVRAVADPVVDLAAARDLFQLDAIEAAALDAGAVSAAEVDRWRLDLAAAAREGTFYAHGVVVMGRGNRPV